MVCQEVNRSQEEQTVKRSDKVKSLVDAFENVRGGLKNTTMLVGALRQVFLGANVEYSRVTKLIAGVSYHQADLYSGYGDQDVFIPVVLMIFEWGTHRGYMLLDQDEADNLIEFLRFADRDFNARQLELLESIDSFKYTLHLMDDQAKKRTLGLIEDAQKEIMLIAEGSVA